MKGIPFMLSFIVISTLAPLVCGVQRYVLFFVKTRTNLKKFNFIFF